jgi:WD40 repeat protein
MLGGRIGRLPPREANWASGYEAGERAETWGAGMLRQARSLLQSARDLRRSDYPTSSNRQRQAGSTDARPDGYDGFISYSHARDGRLAPALQRGLHRFTKPWYRRRALRVFRDETNLAADPGLWSSIEQALASSRFFILLASPDAAASKWVDKEVRWWRSHKPLANLLVALTDGDLVWDDVAGDFDWKRTTAVPMAVKGGFGEEPHYIDLRWARTAEHLSLTDPRFRGSVADLAAPLHGQSKDALFGEDVRQHRRTVRLAGSAIAALTVLTLLAASLAFIARSNQLTAERRGRQATSRYLASQGDAESGSQPDLSMLLSMAALQTDDTLEAHRSLLGQAGQRKGLMRLLGGHASGVSGVAFNPRGGTMASVGNDGTTMLWDTTKSYASAGRLDGRGTTTGAAFSPDGRTLAVAEQQRAVLWDVARKTRDRSLPGHQGRVQGLAFSPNGRLLAAGGWDGRVVVWDLRRDSHPRVVTDKPGPVFSVAFSPDGTTLAWGGADQKVSRWDIARGRPLPPLSGHQGPVLSVAFSPDGTTLAAGGGDGSVLVWDAVRPARPRTLTMGDLAWVTSVAFSPDGNTLASARNDHTIILWDMKSGFPRRPPLTSHTDLVASVAFSPDGSTIASGGADRLVLIWDARGSDLLRGHSDLVRTVAFSRDGKTLASGGMDGRIFVWDVAERRPPRAGIAQGSVGVVAFSPDGKTLASAASRGVQLWDLADLATPAVLPGTGSGGSALAFSPDGRRLAVASGSTVTVWDLAPAPAKPGRTRQHPTTVNSLAFSPDGKTVAAANSDRNLTVWKVDDPANGTAWKAPGPVETVAFSPDGRTLASGGLDKNVTLWDAARHTAPQR